MNTMVLPNLSTPPSLCSPRSGGSFISEHDELISRAKAMHPTAPQQSLQQITSARAAEDSMSAGHVATTAFSDSCTTCSVCGCGPETQFSKPRSPSKRTLLWSENIFESPRVVLPTMGRMWR